MKTTVTRRFQRLTPPFSLLIMSISLVAVSCQRTNRAADTANSAISTEQEAKDLKVSLYYIASDQLEGRGLLTNGLNQAADYIADHFREAGLQPVPGLDGYFQPFKLSVGARNGPNTKLVVAGRELALDKEFVPSSVAKNGAFDAPAEFVGYALANERVGYDDFEGADLKGKVAIAFRFVPEFKKSDDASATPPTTSPSDAPKSTISRRFRAADASLSSKAKNAADHGAVALIVVNPPGKGLDKLTPVTRGGASGDRATIPVMQMSMGAVDAMLSRGGSAKDLKTLEREINESGKPQSFVLQNVTIAGNPDVNREQRVVKNVVAMLPGKGPHADEYVVVGAHYDHLGRGERGSLAFNSTEIHNGADDNGSGTVSVVELAKKMAKGGPRDRTIIFMTFVGEERGLLGSAHFVANSPVPLDKIVAMLNLDMVGRVKDNTLFVGGTGTAAGFEELMQRAANGSTFVFKTPGQQFGGKGGIGPSDHESFAKKKIPVLFFFSGVHPDYHQPSDDPDKINYPAMAQVVDLAARTLDELVKMPREQYVDAYDRSSFGGGNERSNSVQLGVMPDYGSGEEGGSAPGIKITGTVPNTPAARAGLKDGDVLLQIGDKKMKSLEDLMSVLGSAKPGDKVKLIVQRGNERIEKEVTLTARGG